MKKNRYLVSVGPWLCLLLTGCIHLPSPKIGDLPVAVQKVDGVCPKLDGKYAFIGDLVEGADGEQRRIIMTYAFPITDRDGWGEINDGFRYPDTGKREFPDVVLIEPIDKRYISAEIKYNDGSKVGRYTVSFRDQNKFRCNNGVVTWGGESTGRSEFGPNSIQQRYWIWINSTGGVTYKEAMNVDMNLTLFNIPTGTAKHAATYVFQRLE